MVATLITRIPSQELSQGPVDNPKEDIKEGVIPKEAVTPIDEEDPEPPKNPPTPPKQPNPGPSNPKEPDPTPPPKKPQGDPSGNPNPKPPVDDLDDSDDMSDKLNKLKDYDGTRTKYREWIYECHMYITANLTKFTDDKAKILFVLSYMREGTASMYAQRYYYNQELRDWKAGETKLTWGKFKYFLKELAKVFKNKGTKQKAWQKLFTIRMGKRTADDFVANFQ